MHNNIKKEYIWSGILVVGTLCYWYAAGVFSKPVHTEIIPATENQTEEVAFLDLPQSKPVKTIDETRLVGTTADQSLSAKIIINGTPHTVTISDQTTLYAALRELADKGYLSLHAVEYPGLGYFVDTINGVKNANNRYWVYYINNVSATIGVSGYVLQPHDVIEWKYEKSTL